MENTVALERAFLDGERAMLESELSRLDDAIPEARKSRQAWQKSVPNDLRNLSNAAQARIGDALRAEFDSVLALDFDQLSRGLADKGPNEVDIALGRVSAGLAWGQQRARHAIAALDLIHQHVAEYSGFFGSERARKARSTPNWGGYLDSLARDFTSAQRPSFEHSDPKALFAQVKKYMEDFIQPMEKSFVGLAREYGDRDVLAKRLFTAAAISGTVASFGKLGLWGFAKAAVRGAAAGGGFSAAHQGVQLLAGEHATGSFEPSWVLDSAITGGVLAPWFAAAPVLAVPAAGVGVGVGVAEVAEGNVATGLVYIGGALPLALWGSGRGSGRAGIGGAVEPAAGSATRVRRFFWDPREFKTEISPAYWKGGKAAVRSLHHWLFPQRARWVPVGLRNAGFNLVELPGWKVYGRLDLNRWMGFARNWGPTQRFLAGTAENTIRVIIPGGVASVGYLGYRVGDALMPDDQ